MGAFQRLINRLHRVFNKDPQKVKVAAITITGGNGTVEISGVSMTLVTTHGSATFAMTGTITELAAGITNRFNGNVNLQVNEGWGDLLARGILEEGVTDVADNPNLYYPQTLLYHELKTYACILDEQSERIRAAEKELYANTADGEWLELWLNSYFGVPRLEGETDAKYFTRAKYEIFSLRVNNKALMKLISDAVGIYVDVRDLNSDFFVSNRIYSLSNTANDVLFSRNQPYIPNAFGVYIYNGNINNLTDVQKAVIIKTCDRYRAAGTKALYFAPQTYMETWSVLNGTPSITNSKAYVDGPRPSGWQQVSV